MKIYGLASTPRLLDKTKELAKFLSDTDFMCTDDWNKRFKLYDYTSCGEIGGEQQNALFRFGPRSMEIIVTVTVLKLIIQ